MTEHRHISPRLLRAVQRGELPHQALAALLLDHLGEVCPRCREVLKAGAVDEIPTSAYRQSIARALDLRSALEAYERDLAAVPELLRRLKGLSPKQRLLRIRNSPERYANLALGEELLDLARECLPDDPRGSLAWAETAEAVAEGYRRPFPAQRVRALGLQGNAHRAVGDFVRATELLYRARDLMQRHDVADVDVEAELHSFLASLACERNRFEEAAEHLDRAANLYEILHDDQALARVYMKRGILCGFRGDLEGACAADHAALALLSLDTDTALYLAVRLNLAFHLEESGEVHAAHDVLYWDLQLFFQHANAHTRRRIRWLQARLAAHFGELEEAEKTYRRLRDGFAAEGHGCNAALVSLELAVLFHDQGRVGELAEIAAQAVELFRADGLNGEALSALVLLERSAQARSLTAEAIRRTIRLLRAVAPRA